MMNYYLTPAARSNLFWRRHPEVPRYNIEDLGNHRYRMSMEVPGFGESDLKVSVRDNVLSIYGHLGTAHASDDGDGKEDDSRDQDRYLWKGYSESGFERHFNLDENTEVKSATLQDGILHIEFCQQQPEPSKERLIKIKRA